MTGPSQFRPGPPPSLDSRRWARAYQLTQAYGDVNSTLRTAQQSEIAIFWTENTAGHWNRNIRNQAARIGLDAVETARLLAITNSAMADAWIARFFGRNETTFPMDAIVSGVTDVHTFTRYTEAGAEARVARILGGMHYEFSNEAGARIGRQIVRQMFDEGLFRRLRD
jgi:hypothetical protein